MPILIVGSEGAMGKRYQAILRYLKREFLCADKETTPIELMRLAGKVDGFIIATPTDTHFDLIRKLTPLSKPILCEKPITRDTSELEEIRRELRKCRTPFRMQFQYQMLADDNRIGRSRYNYFRHGSDGLYWDCLQIIGLARGEVSLGETSPIWSCMINGKALNLADMDAAYVAYMQRWFSNPSQDMGFIVDVHHKVDAMDRKAALVAL